MSDLRFNIIAGLAWGVPVVVAAMLLPRGRALWAMNGVALVATLCALGLRIGGAVIGDIAGYFYHSISLQFQIVAAVALVTRLHVRRRID